ncbi:excinuclease ABC subunit UvrC [Candidatus Uhrbacteria bacterium]|nr:excinuclease ABC subunit UvrC [Candidatus Uhrbacteria bacterium]
MSLMSRRSMLKSLPSRPGVYRFKNRPGRVIYVGKAANLRRRVSSYFQKAHDRRLEQMVSAIFSVEVTETSSVLEALILEANEIKQLQPKYNIRERDDKSFLYLVFTRENFPRPELVRGRELKERGARRFRSVFGPYLSAVSLRAALQILRKIFSYSTDGSAQKRPCFYYHLKLCPGVCSGDIDAKKYQKIIQSLEMIFSGKKLSLLKELRVEMKRASARERFEEATKLRNQIFALEHLRDVAVLTKDDFGRPEPVRGSQAIDVFGRIEGYDISHTSGAESVGSMAVFENGEPKKSAYRRFCIKTVKGINDVAMMKEILRRRFLHSHKENLWPKPDLILIDGGLAQVNAAKEALKEFGLDVPVIGIAKGFQRKQDRPVFDQPDLELTRIVEQYKDLLLRLRDEAHRFAVSYHRRRLRQRL